MYKYKTYCRARTERSGRWIEHGNQGEKKVLSKFLALFLEVVFTEMVKTGRARFRDRLVLHFRQVNSEMP